MLGDLSVAFIRAVAQYQGMNANHTLSLSFFLPLHSSGLLELWREAALHGAEAFGWRLGERELDLGPVALPHPAPGAAVSLPEMGEEAEYEVRTLLALLRFLGRGGVQVRSRLNLIAFKSACIRLQQELGLPVDPWFVLERELHEYRGLGGIFLLEVEKGEDPRDAVQGTILQRIAATGQTLLELPDNAYPVHGWTSRVYRLIHVLPPRPDPAPPYNKRVKEKFEYRSYKAPEPQTPAEETSEESNLELDEEGLKYLEEDIRYFRADEESEKLIKEMQRKHGAKAIEDMRALGAMLASVFRFCLGQHLQEAAYFLYDLSFMQALIEYEKQLGRPMGINYRVPVVTGEDLKRVESACRRHNLAFPPGPKQIDGLITAIVKKYGTLTVAKPSLIILQEMAKRMSEEQRAIVLAVVERKKVRLMNAPKREKP